MTRLETIAAHPDFPWLAASAPASVENLLKRINFLPPSGHVIACAKAGDGNMNLTLRVRVQDSGVERSIIVKQSRPWVEKYDFIAAPWDRAISELRFYERVKLFAGVAARMPMLLGEDRESRVLILEDLSPAHDLSNTYQTGTLDRPPLLELADYLRVLHNTTHGISDSSFANREMRQLNHQHIYVIPLQDANGLELESIEPTLVPAARELREDCEYLALVAETGERYLSDGPCLLHGDFFPGSWLAAAGGVRVIDPEFSFAGDPEFDVANALAHLRLAQLPYATAVDFLHAYQSSDLDMRWLARFAACEVMRRLIGYAQLPLLPGGWRAELLRASRSAMLAGRLEELWPR